MTTLQARRWAAWSSDTAERAAKTAIQTGAMFAVGELGTLVNAINSSPADYLPTEAVFALPVLMAALSVATSWLSKFTGRTNTARFRDA